MIHAYRVTASGVEYVIGLRQVPGGWLFGYEPAAPVFALAYITGAGLLVALNLTGTKPVAGAAADPLNSTGRSVEG